MRQILLLLLLLPLLSTAQNWSPVRPDLSYMYEYPDTTIEYFSVREDFGRYYGLDINDSTITASSTVYQSSYILGAVDFVEYYGTSWPVIHYQEGPKGSALIKNNIGNNFTILTSSGDSIYLPSSYEVSSAWTFYETDSLKFTAEVTTLAPELVVDSLDSVATITLSYEQKSDGPAEHPMDGAILKISKNFGLFQHPDLYSFPETSMLGYINLAGIDPLGMGIQNITAEDLDLKPGQIHHLMDFSYAEYTNYAEREIISVSETDTNFLVRYNSRKVEIIQDYDPDLGQVVNTDYIWTEGIDTLKVNKNGFPSLPGKFVDQSFLYGVKMDSVEKIYYSNNLGTIVFKGDTVVNLVGIIDGNMYPHQGHFHIYEGPWSGKGGAKGPGPYTEFLYNYLPGEFEYGEPFDFDSLYNITGISASNRNVESLQLYPNPVDRGEQINLPESLVTFEVRDVNGRVLSTEDKRKLRLSNPGFYIITGEDADGVMYQGKVLVR